MVTNRCLLMSWLCRWSVRLGRSHPASCQSTWSTWLGPVQGSRETRPHMTAHEDRHSCKLCLNAHNQQSSKQPHSLGVVAMYGPNAGLPFRPLKISRVWQHLNRRSIQSGTVMLPFLTGKTAKSLFHVYIIYFWLLVLISTNCL